MENQTLFNLAGSAVLLAIGWWCKEIWDSVKALKEDLKDLEVELPTTYVNRDDYREDIRELKDLMQRVFDKLDEKADK